MIVRDGADLIVGCDSRVTYGGEVEVTRKWMRTSYGLYVTSGSAGWARRVQRAIGPAGYQSADHAMDVIHDAMVSTCGTMDRAQDSVSILAAVITDRGLAAIYADHTGDVREVGQMEAIGCSLAARVAWPLLWQSVSATDRVRACMAHVAEHTVAVGPPYHVWRVTADGVQEAA